MIAAGTKFGRYEIRSKIGEGGMGEVAADGQRFLVNSPAGEVSQTPITVVLNWTSSLKR